MLQFENVSTESRPLDSLSQLFIVGNPNVGKTTLFNDLTGAHEKVANYGGVTTEIKRDTCFDNHGRKWRIHDLPGTYGVSAYAQEEQANFELLYSIGKFGRVLFVIDARSFERNLFLGTQLLEMGLPLCFVFTFIEQAQKLGHSIDKTFLEKRLGVPVVFLSKYSQVRQRQLKDILSQDLFRINKDFYVPFPEQGHVYLDALYQQTGISKKWCPLLLLQGNSARERITAEEESYFLETISKLNQAVVNWETKYIAARYDYVHSIAEKAIVHTEIKRRYFNFDQLFLHPLWGPVVIGFTFLSLFMFVFGLSEYPTRWCEASVQVCQTWCQSYLPDGWFKNMLVEGIIGGVGNVLLFFPQFILMIMGMAILENTGYLTRVTFLLDRWMKKMGLSGPSFIALISCYACTIPGIMQTRCLHNRGERLTTLFVAPWVNCSSRMPIYLLLISLLFPQMSSCGKTFILIAIYLISLVAALLLATFIRKCFLKKQPHVHIMEMPPLLFPQFSYIFHLVKSQSWLFFKKAGTYILAFSIALWLCLHISFKNSNHETTNGVYWLGEKLAYIFEPIGFDRNISLGLLCSFGARENFISTLGVLHNEAPQEEGCLRMRLQKAVNAKGQPVYSVATCVSLILFFMFSLQCLGTFVFVKHETYSWRLTLLQFAFMNVFAYILCFIVYHSLS